MAGKNEARFRATLDTKQAKSELRGMVKQAENAGGRVSKGVRNAVRRGLTATGLGVGLGAGIAAIRQPTESGLQGVVGEALGGIGHRITEFFLGDLNEKSRASQRARDDTIQAFSYIAGATNSIPPGAKSFFDNVQSLYEQQERGRELFEQDADFRGPSIGEIVDRILSALGELIADAVDALAERLWPF